MTIAINESYFNFDSCRADAEGKQWRDPKSPFNGGLQVEGRTHLDRSDRLVRFVPMSITRDKQQINALLNSPWWLNEDRFALLVTRARSMGVSVQDTARQQLALPDRFNAAVGLIAARPKAGVLLAAYRGRGRMLYDANGDREYGFPTDVATKYGAVHWTDQLYVPGLGRMPWLATPPATSNADQWLEFDGFLDLNGQPVKA